MGIPIVSEKYILARLKAGREIEHSAYLMVPHSQQLRSSPPPQISCFASLTLLLCADCQVQPEENAARHPQKGTMNPQNMGADRNKDRLVDVEFDAGSLKANTSCNREGRHEMLQAGGTSGSKHLWEGGGDRIQAAGDGSGTAAEGAGKKVRRDSKVAGLTRVLRIFQGRRMRLALRPRSMRYQMWR